MSTATKGNLLRSLLFTALSVCAFIFGGYLLARDTNGHGAAQGGVALLGAIFSGFLANLQNFESFKATASGFEAKIREAQTVIDDAKATIASLHQLATMTGAFLVDGIAGSGRLAGRETIRQKDEAKTRLLRTLEAIGLSDEAVSDVRHADRYWTLLDYLHGLFVRPQNNQQWKLSPEDTAARTALFESPEDASPERCEELLTRLGWHDPFTSLLLDEYRHYFHTSEHRRLAVWQERATWDQQYK